MAQHDPEEFTEQRERMVETQLVRRGIDDVRVLEAMGTVPREAFVDEQFTGRAYHDGPLPIGEGQTISQPFIVALQCQALELEPDDAVLEIGTGSGYAAAVLSRIVDEVYTMERLESLCERAKARYAELGYDNIHVRCADGTRGWEDAGPFDAIVSAASGPDVPQSLKDQLGVGGRLVMPVGGLMSGQMLVRLRRTGTGPNDFEREDLGEVRFVPLIGSEGWDADKNQLHARNPWSLL